MTKCEICLRRIYPWQRSLMLPTTKLYGHVTCDFIVHRVMQTLEDEGLLLHPETKTESVKDMLIAFGLLPSDTERINYTAPETPVH